jgi:hypothetical protein
MIGIDAKNAYVVIPPWNDEACRWNPFDPDDLPMPDCAYIGAVMRAMERDAGVAGFTFYITTNLQRLPSYGDRVVVVLIADEWCRIPLYAFKVRSVFKTYGTQLQVHGIGPRSLSAYDIAAFVQDARTSLIRLPSRVATAAAIALERLRGRKSAWRIFDIPLGYYRQIALPFVPIGERRFDVYFAGSVANRGTSANLRQQLTPKFLSRARMLHYLRALAARRPDLAVETALTVAFANEDAAVRYSQTMMQTKICVVPRGTSLETYRYFEGLRVGCIVITEGVPRRWFYDGAPVLAVRDWSELDTFIPELLRDPSRLETISQASLAWWSTRCSEDVVGGFVADTIRDR